MAISNERFLPQYDAHKIATSLSLLAMTVYELSACKGAQIFLRMRVVPRKVIFRPSFVGEGFFYFTSRRIGRKQGLLHSACRVVMPCHKHMGRGAAKSAPEGETKASPLHSPNI